MNDHTHQISTSISHDTGSQVIFFWHCTCGAEGDPRWTSGTAAESAGDREHLNGTTAP